MSIRNTPARRVRRQAPRAFTLLEIIVVVTIIALLATMVAPKLLQNIGKTKTKVARTEVSTIANQLGIYLADNGSSRPTQDMELIVLTEGASPYLKPADLKDPWGRDYILMVPGPSGSDFDIISYGADGEPGGEGEDKDVNNNID
jgi:general secretion pathway protein G